MLHGVLCYDDDLVRGRCKALILEPRKASTLMRDEEFRDRHYSLLVKCDLALEE